MFTMNNAIKSINNSIRCSSVLMKAPVLVSLLIRGGPPRPDQEKLGSKFAGTVAMTTTTAAAASLWLGNSRKCLRKLGEFKWSDMLENVHVCLGGMAATTTTVAAAKKYSPVGTMTTRSGSELSVSSRLFSFFNFSSSIVSRVRSISQFVWYGQMSSSTAVTVGFVQDAWQRWVNLENDRRMMHDRMKMMKEYESYQQELIKQQKMAAEAEAFKKSLLWLMEDTKAIEDYSGEGYSDMNAALRCPSEMTDETQVRVDAVVKAMAKLTSVQAPVYRRTDLPDAVARNIQVGAEYQDLGFMSTSRDQEQTAFFQGEYLFVINCVSGVDIMEHAVTKDEAEVLYPPGTRFFIKSVKTEVVTSEDYDDEEVIVVAMDEVATKKPTR